MIRRSAILAAMFLAGAKNSAAQDNTTTSGLWAWTEKFRIMFTFDGKEPDTPTLTVKFGDGTTVEFTEAELKAELTH